MTLASAQTAKPKTKEAAASLVQRKPDCWAEGIAETVGVPLFLQRRAPSGTVPPILAPLESEEPAIGAAEVQPKPVVSQPGDIFEREADAVARAATGAGGDSLHVPGPAQLQDGPDQAVRRHPTASPLGADCAQEEQEQPMQRKSFQTAAAGSLQAPGGLLQPPDSGSLLSDSVRAKLEPVLGADLGSARVHTSPPARQAAARLDARAFTHQEHIWLGPGESAEDLTLMAHEATHVAQQTGGSALPILSRGEPGLPGDQSLPVIQRQIAEDPREGTPPRARSRREDAAGTPPLSPVLEGELAEVTAGGSVSARREPGRPTILEPGSNTPQPPGSPAAMPVTTDAPPPRVLARGEVAHPAPSSPVRTPPAAGGEAAGRETSADGGERLAGERGALGGKVGAPSDGAGDEPEAEGLSEGEFEKGGVVPGDETRPDAAADPAVLESALTLIPAPNPEGVRERILARSAPEPAPEAGAAAAARERVQQLLQTLRAEALLQKEAIAATAEARKAELQAEAEARIQGIGAREESATAAARAGFAQARAALESESAGRRAELTEVTEAEAARAESETAGRIAEAEAQFTERQTALSDDAETARQQPPLIAADEAARADGELEVAALECERAGDQEAAKYSGSEDSDAEKRAAARQVANESAADIRDKKSAIREDLAGRAEDFSGQYLEYAATVNQKIGEAKDALVPELRSRGERVAASILEAEGGAARALDERLAADLAALSSGEEQAVASIRDAAEAATADVRRTAAQAEGAIDAVAVSSHAAIDNRAAEIEAAVSDPGMPADGSAAVVEEGIASVTQIGSATQEQLDVATAAGVGELAARGGAFDSHAAQLQDEAATTAQRLQQEASAALGAAVETHRAHAAEALTTLAADQATLQTTVLAEVDAAMADARGELGKINDQFRDEVRTAADEAIEEAIKPRTDQVETRAAEAADQVDDAWYEGLFRAIGQIVIGLVILVVVALVVAAIAAAFGVILTAWTAVMIAGALLLAAGFILALIQRSGEDAYQGRPGAMIGRAALDAIGVTGIQEAWTGHDVSTGRRLSAGERTERGTLGAVTLISLVLGVRSAIKGPPGGVFTRPGTLPPVRGAPGGVLGGLKAIGGRMLQGARSVASQLWTGLKETPGRIKEWWTRKKESTWKEEFWPDDIESLPPAVRTIEVNAASIRNTKPEFVRTPEFPEGAWKWTLYDEVSGAKFCEVHAKVSGGPSNPAGAPEMALNAKQALLPTGERVALKGNGFSFTTEAMNRNKRVFGEIFGRAPANMSGDLEADNRLIFQREFARLRELHPDWSNEALANEAVKVTPFAKTRVKGGYGDFRVQASNYANVSPELTNVPTTIRVEALPTREHPPPNLPPSPVPVPTPTPRDDDEP